MTRNSYCSAFFFLSATKWYSSKYSLSVITPCALLPKKHSLYMHSVSLTQEKEEENGKEYKLTEAKEGECAKNDYVWCFFSYSFFNSKVKIHYRLINYIESGTFDKLINRRTITSILCTSTVKHDILSGVNILLSFFPYLKPIN